MSIVCATPMSGLPAPKGRDEEEIAAAIKQAVLFTCTIQRDRSYLTLAYPTLKRARAAQPIFEEKVNNGRKALVYAVTMEIPGGRTILIPDWFEP